jgi:hypothetical protein
LEPEKWVGQRLPLLDYVDVGDELAHGNWRVLLYRHDCLRCVAVLPQYDRLACVTDRKAVAGVALIEFPPYAPRNASRDGPNVPGCRRGRVSGQYEWLVETPLEIQVVEGVVVASHHVVDIPPQSEGFPPS